MVVQFHSFTSSFFPADKGRWLPFAYGTLLFNIVLAMLGYIPEGIQYADNIPYPDYGIGVFFLAIPMLILLARNLWIFIPGLKSQDNLMIRNQIISILLSLVVLTVFLLLALTPLIKEIPISHIGNIINAIVLSYAVVNHQLLDIRLILRQGFTWISIVTIGIISFLAIYLVFHSILNVELTPKQLFASTVSYTIAVIIIFKLRYNVSYLMGKAFQGERYYHQKKLVDFASTIHKIFSLHEQGRELLTLLIRAVGCGKAGLLFLGTDGGFEIKLIEPGYKSKENSMMNYKLRAGNPVIAYLKRERRPLTRESLTILPEFLGVWQEERETIETNDIELFMPLISRERLIGILVLDNKKTGRYNLEDYNLLKKITNQVAVSMEKEYLWSQLKEREEELSIINRSNLIISSSLNIQSIYDNFIKELKQIVEVDWAAITVIEDTELYFMAISTEVGSPWKVGEKIPLKGTVTEWAAKHHQLIQERNLSKEVLFDADKRYSQYSLRSIVYLPLIISNRVIGTLAVASCKEDAYNARHIKLLEQLALQIAMPIENARLYAKTERLARVDSLTGLLNRRSLDEVLSREISRHSRYGGAFSLIIFDIDSFKLFNDNYGHLAGDELLRQIGVIINKTIRETDMAFRFGGDEFAVLLPLTTINAALMAAERIRQKAFASMEIGSVPVSISLGVASWPADGISPNEILKAADQALYQAKRAGGNRSVCSIVDYLKASHEINVVTSVPETRENEALSAILALAAAVDARSCSTHDHSKRVHDYAIAIGKGLGMTPIEIEHLGTCALLHDIGKIGISDDILNKKDVLNDSEREIIKTHSTVGAAIVRHSSQLSSCVEGILHHHEKFDGEGYPDGLKGEKIPLESRIVAIADVFASMTSKQNCSQELTYETAIEEIKNGAGTQFDPKLVDVFLKVISEVMKSTEHVSIRSKTD